MFYNVSPLSQIQLVRLVVVQLQETEHLQEESTIEKGKHAQVLVTPQAINQPPRTSTTEFLKFLVPTPSQL